MKFSLSCYITLIFKKYLINITIKFNFFLERVLLGNENMYILIFCWFFCNLCISFIGIYSKVDAFKREVIQKQKSKISGKCFLKFSGFFALQSLVYNMMHDQYLNAII